ncbi:MAG: 50S ribosomal protein L10, partial [Planctomycetota bacterium]|nr:50S ribosomal protein L10 [Planctomycetota bacterium]
YEGFVPRGGVMDGASLTSEEVVQVSKWPSREEQLSILVGQILSPGATLAAQLIGPGGALASQIKQKAEDGPEAE